MMPVTSRELVEFILLGPMEDRRQLQDSPILGDVWIEFATSPTRPKDLLISPYTSSRVTQGAGPLAYEISKRLEKYRDSSPRRSKRSHSKQTITMRPADAEEAHVAYLQGVVAARLFFPEVMRVIVPMTYWWHTSKYRVAQFDLSTIPDKVRAILRWVKSRQPEHESEQRKAEIEIAPFSALDRYLILAGLVLWSGTEASKKGSSAGLGAIIEELNHPEEVGLILNDLYQSVVDDERRLGRVVQAQTVSSSQLAESELPKPLVYQISMNRIATPALERSVPAVKGDAARTLFTVKCNEIGWAIIDSGVDGNHPAFGEPRQPTKSRIVRSFDFTTIREIVSLDNLRPTGSRRNRFEDRVKKLTNQRDITFDDASRKLQELAADASNERPINWEIVEPFIEIPPTTEPYSGHGTHVAGILGGSKAAMENDDAHRMQGFGIADGLCPDIKLYDFRVLARSQQDTEFAIIAAMQYIRYLNERHNFLVIHGANLSLSIKHDVRNYACGRTPVCQECERLVESGVVVVAAAGNRGYHNFDTSQGGYEGYAAFSITDPGNADCVITVGATHRFWPHTYGVSFFSSRGPTGDGRLKPDLVAPGERIESVLPINKEKWGQLDGTSMAAPHVSGAAAMLMARYSELVGQPRRIKRILCETATDLERERTFQGYGMLDVLRAFQSV